jgi:hypothetical protein
MPLTDGVAPLRNVEWPEAVTVGKWIQRASVKIAPWVKSRSKPPVYSARKRVR